VGHRRLPRPAVGSRPGRAARPERRRSRRAFEQPGTSAGRRR
jgi:hypothetical protein